MRATLVLFLAAVGAGAAPPVVTLPAEVKGEVSAFVTVRAEVKDAKAVKYVPLDAGLSVFPADLLTDKTATVVVAQAAGRYRILAYAGNADGPSDPVITTVVIGTPPPPEPMPDPDSKPKPKPGTADLWLIVVEETNERTVPTAAVLNDLAYWRSLNGRGHQWRFFDQDNPDAAGYVKEVNDRPGLLVMSKAGKKLYAGKLPSATAGVDTVIKSVGGK